MQRLNGFPSHFMEYARAQETEALFQAIGAIEAAIPMPHIDRGRAEYTLHRLTASMLASKRTTH